MSARFRPVRIAAFALALALLAGGPAAPRAQAGPHRLTDEERKACEKLGRGPLPEWRKPDPKKYPPPSTDLKAQPYELPVAFTVVNHEGGFLSWGFDDDEVAYHLERLRETLRPCGIEPVLESARFLKAPSFLDDLDREPDGKLTLSEQERCLFKATFKAGAVNVYFVEESDAASAQQGHGGTHALSEKAFTFEYQNAEPDDRRFAGAVVITDAPRVGGGAMGERGRRVCVAHEVGHVVFNSGHYSPKRLKDGSWEPRANIMSGEAADVHPIVNDEQCAAARSSPFVRKRGAGSSTAVELAREASASGVKCEPAGQPGAEPLTRLCAGPENTELLRVGFCDPGRQRINPFAIAYNPGLGTAGCRNYLMNEARAQAASSKSAADPLVKEGALLYVYEDMRLSAGAGKDLVQTVAKTLASDTQAKADRYCRLVSAP